jgi:hypothetical protein
MKQNLQIDLPEGADMHLQAKKLLLEKLLKHPGDCFGVDYEEGNKDCQSCLWLASLEGRKEPVNVFCKEIFYQNKDVSKMEANEPEVVTEPVVVTKPIKTLKPKPEKKVPEEWRLELHQMVDNGVDKDVIISTICSKYSLVKKLVLQSYVGYKAARSRYPKNQHVESK